MVKLSKKEKNMPVIRFIKRQKSVFDTLYEIGVENPEELSKKKTADYFAKAVKGMQAAEINAYCIDAGLFFEIGGAGSVYEMMLGIGLGLYQPECCKSEKTSKESMIYLLGCPEDELDRAEVLLDQTAHLCEGICFARNLVNAPSNLLTPEKMVFRTKEFFRELLEEGAVEIEILDEKQIELLGMEAFLAVGMTSGHMPRLIVIRYKGNPTSKELTALVGKGVTCDTGGYCLKSASSLPGVKGDNGGGAAVIGAIYALAKNKSICNAVAVIPACENRISREGFIPGDVIGSMSGKTIEIGNTDAEGRLILADAVTYAIQKEHADRIVNIATLTGAVAAMFGFYTAGTLASDDKFYLEFEAAAKQAGEQYWRLPIFEEYKRMLESSMADISNTSNNGCGCITAGLFIEAFTQKLPWIHIDIAGTAWVNSPQYAFETKGATGAGAASLYHLLNR